jgi:hypothetical protein
MADRVCSVLLYSVIFVSKAVEGVVMGSNMLLLQVNLLRWHCHLDSNLTYLRKDGMGQTYQVGGRGKAMFVFGVVIQNSGKTTFPGLLCRA